jgi:hypothetical protein
VGGLKHGDMETTPRHAKSAVEIDFDTIEFTQLNGNGSEIHFNNGRTMTVRESPMDICKRTAAAPLQVHQASGRSRLAVAPNGLLALIAIGFLAAVIAAFLH